MDTKIIMAPNLMGKTAKIITKIRNMTCIDDDDAEVIKEILQYELNEYCVMLEEYYVEEYYNELYRARNSAYDDGYDDGYDIGYDDGYSESHSEV